MIDWDVEAPDVIWQGAISDGSQFAVDASAVPDLDLGVEMTGLDNLTQALFRRLITPRGGLFYDGDYGFDVRRWLNDHGTEQRVYELATGIALECEKDPRIEEATVDVTQLDQRRALIHIQCRLPLELARFALAWDGQTNTLAIWREGDRRAYSDLRYLGAGV